MIEPLKVSVDTPDMVPSRKKLMEKINEIVSVLNKNTSPPKSSTEEVSFDEPLNLAFEGYTPVGGNANAPFFMPPPGTGHVESDGNVIHGMIARNRLPAHVLHHFNGGGNE